MTKSLRPRLWILSPIVFSIVVGFIVLNVCFGLSLWFSSNRVSYIVENRILTTHVWGGIFVFLACGLLFGVVSRRARIVKNFLIAGLTVKFIWWFAFVALAFKFGIWNTIAALGFWFFVSMVQAVAVMLFPPTEQDIQKEVSERLVEISQRG